MLPHPINVVRVKLTGEELKKLLLKVKSKNICMSMHKVLVSRRHFGGYILYRLGFIESEGRYFVDGKEIQNDEYYILGTVDMYTFGRYFPSLKGLPTEYIMPEFYGYI